MTGKGTRAVDALAQAGVPFTLHEYDETDAPARAGRGRERRPSYGLDAAVALGVDPSRIFKTLVATIDGRLVVGVVPVAAELDLKRLASAVGGRRAELADPGVAERATGYVVGGISPLAQRRRLPTVVDSSALSWPTIYVSGGRRGLQVELAPGDLVSTCGGEIHAIARVVDGGDEATT